MDDPGNHDALQAGQDEAVITESDHRNQKACFFLVFFGLSEQTKAAFASW